MLKLALVFSLVGLFGLSLLAYISSPELVKIADVEGNLGRRVIVAGEIASASYHASVSFLEVCEESNCVKVVFFDLPSHRLSKGDLVEIEGEVKLYEGDVEIIAEEIKLL
jgi:exonuclease VII large subunit